MVTYYVLTTAELLALCTASTLAGCIMSIIGLRLSSIKKVRETVIGMYQRVQRG